MINRPVIKAHLHVEVMPGEGVLLLSECAAKILHGEAYEKIVPLLDGRRGVDEIIDALAGQVDATRVFYILNNLESKGFLAEATPGIPTSVSEFWHGTGVDPSDALSALREKRVAVRTMGEVNSAAMLRAMETMGLQLGSQEEAGLWLALTDDYLRADLAVLNAAALEKQCAWILARLTGPELWLGPLFVPGETGCWECLRLRLERNRAVHRLIAEKKHLATPPLTARGALPATEAVVCHMAAVVAARYLAGAAQGLAGHVLCIDWATLASQSHPLARHPHCRACGTAEQAVMRPIELQSVKAAFVSDGGHRAVAPETTLKKYEHLVSPITGVVRLLAPIVHDESIAHVYLAGHNPAMTMDRLDSLKKSLRQMSSGKGMSATQAKTSALCEALERYSGEFMGGEFRVTRAWREWKDGEACHPNDIMRYSARQYQEREVWNSKGSRFNRVPELLEENTPIDWTPVWSLTAQRHKFLPTQFVYFRAPATDADETIYAVGCSNGNAAGNTLEEAVLQGFFELVERDAVALWWYNRLRKPGVAINSFGEPYLLELAEQYRQKYQREFWALDVTSDIGIPVFVAVSKCIDRREERLLLGLGCHLDARIALHRAFSEMNQMLGLVRAGEGGALAVEDGETLHWLREATVLNQPYVAADPVEPLKRLGDYPVRHRGDFLENINYCRRIIEAQGMEMLVLDQTRADVGMPVVKVVVPGLRHFWARFAPGRLYDVPVKMGWLKKPLREDELNPIPMFI